MYLLACSFRRSLLRALSLSPALSLRSSHQIPSRRSLACSSELLPGSLRGVPRCCLFGPSRAALLDLREVRSRLLLLSLRGALSFIVSTIKKSARGALSILLDVLYFIRYCVQCSRPSRQSLRSYGVHCSDLSRLISSSISVKVSSIFRPLSSSSN